MNVLSVNVLSVNILTCHFGFYKKQYCFQGNGQSTRTVQQKFEELHIDVMLLSSRVIQEVQCLLTKNCYEKIVCVLLKF